MFHQALLATRANEGWSERFARLSRPIRLNQKKLSVPQPEEGLRTLRIRASAQHKIDLLVLRLARTNASKIPEGEHLACHNVLRCYLGILRRVGDPGSEKISNRADSSATLPKSRRSGPARLQKFSCDHRKQILPGFVSENFNAAHRKSGCVLRSKIAKSESAHHPAETSDAFRNDIPKFVKIAMNTVRSQNEKQLNEIRPAFFPQVRLNDDRTNRILVTRASQHFPKRNS
jgi:hypothetical protein